MTEARGPDFFIVGAPKCGTSSMHHYLAQHPQIFLPEMKDVPFFGSDLQHTIPGAAANQDEYLSRFAGAPRGVRIGDSATQYMQSVKAASEIAEWRPNASIIVMLRDPVELMYSLHSHNIWMTEEDILDFESAIAAESDRRSGWRIPAQCNIPATLWYRDVAALGDQLARYLAIFPRENVHVILIDELREDARGVVDRTLRFLGLTTDVPLDLNDVVNGRRAPRSLRVQKFLQQPPASLERAYRAVTPDVLHARLLPFLNKFNETTRNERMNAELRSRLGAEARPQVDRLEALLDRDLPGWCGTPAPQEPGAGSVSRAEA